MRSVFQSVLLALARATNPELAKQVESLIQQNQFLKTENHVLRGRLPDRVIPTPEERRLLMKFGAPLGNAIKGLITIVSASTFFRWLREEKRGKPPGTPGRRKRCGSSPPRRSPDSS
jgi:putative transposase